MVILTSERRRGEMSVLGGAVLWSFFPIVTVVAVDRLPPLITAALSTLCAAVFFAILLTVRRRWKMLWRRAGWADAVRAGVLIGFCFYALVFLGYTATTPGNGAIMSLMEVLCTFLIVQVGLRHEPFHVRHVGGAACMLAGALAILGVGWTGSMHRGDLLILLATVVAPFGNIYAQRARRVFSSDALLFIRSVLAGCMLLVFAWFREGFPAWAHVQSSWFFLLLQGVVLMGLSKILWIEAVHRLPIGKTIALSQFEVVLTLLLAWLLLGDSITPAQGMGLLPMAVGMWLLLSQPRGGSAATVPVLSVAERVAQEQQ